MARLARRRLTAVAAALMAAMGTVGAIALHSAGASPRTLPTGPIYGVTIDDISNVAGVNSANAALPHMPTTRVYFDVKEPASYYTSAVASLDTHSYVMGEMLDSSDMKSITPTAEHTRVADLLSTLGSSVDIWEVGNEVNGNWTGPYSTGASMVTDAYDQVVAAGGRTALTLYYNIGCGDGASELDPITYSDQYLSASVRDGLDYVLLSYYQTQCNNQVLSASTVTSYVEQLHTVFPNALLGFGEVGLPNPVTSSTQAEAISIIDHYYTLGVNLPYYIGGYFYWYYLEDAVPYQGNQVWAAISSSMQTEGQVLPGGTSATTTTTAASSTTVASSTTTAPSTTTTAAPTTTSTTVATSTTSSTSSSTTVLSTTTSTTPTTAAPTTTVAPTTTTAPPLTTAPLPVVSPSVLSGTPTPAGAPYLTPFSSMTPSTWTVGTPVGSWDEQWDGYGQTAVVYDSSRGRYVLSISPEVSTSSTETHSTLVTSVPTFTSPTFTVPVRTVEQLRQGSPPNPWEVGWVLWDYTPDDSFYGLVLKPTGWELMKETKGVESFISVGSSPQFQVGRWYDVTVSQQGSQISVTVDGQPLVTASDSSFTSGAIGLYCEDSVAHYGNVTVTNP